MAKYQKAKMPKGKKTSTRQKKPKYSKQDLDKFMAYVSGEDPVEDIELPAPDMIHDWDEIKNVLRQDYYTDAEIEDKVGWLRRVIQSGEFSVGIWNAKWQEGANDDDMQGFKYGYQMDIRGDSWPEQYFLLSNKKLPLEEVDRDVNWDEE